jgi:hypothetical protein
VALVLLATAAAAFAASAWQQQREDADLGQRLARVQAPAPSALMPCREPGAAMPQVLLVLGQSNAGNHGAEDGPPGDGAAPRIKVFTARGCQWSGDPLPGGTGQHRSIWARLPAHLQRSGETRETVVALLAVDGTRVADWARRHGPLHARLVGLLRELRAAGLAPDRVLWQQGEADARSGTSAAAYVQAFEEVLSALRAEDVAAPVLLARSTACHGSDGSAVGEALLSLRGRHADVWPGPDTDALRGAYRAGGCHFSRQGLDAAAALWAQALVARRQ